MYLRILTLLICALCFNSCSPNSKSVNYRRLSKGDLNKSFYKGHFKIGQKYTIKNTTYKPQPFNKSYKAIGVASWYGAELGFHGSSTANGDTFNKEMLTAAHRTLPMPSVVRVTNLENNKSLLVMVNDRGPFKKGRIIDLSERASQLLGYHKQGIAKVKVEYMRKETNALLHKLSLKPESGYVSKEQIKNSHCSVNCYMHLLNKKYKIHTTKIASQRPTRKPPESFKKYSKKSSDIFSRVGL